MEESPDRLQGSVHGFFYLIEEVMLFRRSAPCALGPLLLNNLAMLAIGYALQSNSQCRRGYWTFSQRPMNHGWDELFVYLV